MSYIIRPMKPTEYDQLAEFLYQAIYVPPATPPPERSILHHPELRLYLDGFGERADDHALAAVMEGQIVGAIWVRIMPDYGHIDDTTPSLAMSVLAKYRGRGIGTKMLQEMLHYLGDKGYHRVSLSVQKDNYALAMYQAAGCELYQDNPHDVVLVCRLEGQTKYRQRGNI